VGNVACMGGIRNGYTSLVGKCDGTRRSGSPRLRCEDNIKMDLRESVCKVGDCIHLAYDKVRWRAVVSFTFHKRRAVS
jgi:hypothetical protein